MGYAIPSVLSIAGSDSSGGAGIQADIKTIEAFRLFAQTALTAITAQNTTGVQAVQEVEPAIVEAQIDAVFSDIRPQAVKVGMISSAGIACAVAAACKRHGASNIVVDPVMVATSGSSLMQDSALAELRRSLLPMASVITPNIPEAQVLAETTILTEKDMEEAAKRIAEYCPGTVLVKGGHSVCAPGQANDVALLPSGELVWFRGPWVENPNTHGTGCTLSSAIACGLAEGLGVSESIARAKEYLTGALRDGLDMGVGSGPLNHHWQAMSD